VAFAGTKDADFPNVRPVNCSVPRGEAFAEWVAAEARDGHGATITEEAIGALQEAVGSDTMRVASELDKLVSYVHGDVIDVDAVRAVTGTRKGKTLGDLLDAVAARDATTALSLVADVLESPRNNAVTVIMALTVQTLALTWGHHARGRVDYFALLKSTSAFPMRPWGEAAACWSRNQKRWSARALRDAMQALRDADQAAKDTRVASDDQLLSSLVCAMCAEARRVAA
jgi:DNA polymerase-3 subunit delta